MFLYCQHNDNTCMWRFIHYAYYTQIGMLYSDTCSTVDASHFDHIFLPKRSFAYLKNRANINLNVLKTWPVFTS